VETSPLPEDVDQDEVDEAIRRVRARIEDAVARAGLTGVAVRVRTEIREGCVWVVGDLTPRSDDRT
jgi:hypothetical protein